jgi:hypothetical protein
MTSLCPLVKTPCCRCRLSLILRWQHWTRTLPAVEPITAAMSEAVFPWAAKPRIVLMALGVKTRRTPRRNPPLGATGTMFKSPPIDLLVVIAPRSCPSLGRTGPRHRPCNRAPSCAGASSFWLGGRSSIRVSVTYRDTGYFRKPLIFCVCGLRTFWGGALRQSERQASSGRFGDEACETARRAISGADPFNCAVSLVRRLL